MTRSRNRRSPRPLVRAALFALLGLLGLVSLIVSPWTGVVLILVTDRRRLDPAALGEQAAP
jgi:hypothetical protein